MDKNSGLIRTLERLWNDATSRTNREEAILASDRGRAQFADDVLRDAQRHKVGVWKYLATANPVNAMLSPLILAGIFPVVFLDAFISLYQAVCFPAYGIPKVRRSDYMAFDRNELPYLNAIEKVFCAYCSYANGVAAYYMEMSARTEQYWCPIKHARKISAQHGRFPKFFEYGDAESYRAGLKRLRKELGEEEGDL